MDYIIKNEHMTLTVEDQGAQAVKWTYDGKDYIRERDEVWGSCAPLLFPIVGLFKDNYTMIDGKRYEMGSHGFIRRHVLKVFKQEESKITFLDDYSVDSLKMWPYKHQFAVTYELVDNKLKVTMDVINVDDKVIYFNIGGHPGIRCPLYDGEKFEDYSLVFNKTESFESPSINGNCLDFDHPEFTFNNVDEIKLDYKYFDVDAIVIKDIKSDIVKLVNKDNKGVAFKWDGFNTVAFWTKPGSKYLCFEPWKGYADKYDSDHDFLKKDDLVSLLPGEKATFSFEIEIL